MIALRAAAPHDEEWINARYRELGFLLSDLERDEVVLAEVDGERAGMGRLVPAGPDACELGGMFVADAFRGRGVARALIEELLQRARGREVYCIPFAELEPIYAASGFERIQPAPELPGHVQDKLAWCERAMARPVILMKKF
jgi:N-acetylglutamate synthase-like GNAT family acetyltransferase